MLGGEQEAPQRSGRKKPVRPPASLTVRWLAGRRPRTPRNSAMKQAVAVPQPRTAPMSKRHAFASARPSGKWRRKLERSVWGSRIGTVVWERARSSCTENRSGRSTSRVAAPAGAARKSETRTVHIRIRRIGAQPTGGGVRAARSRQPPPRAAGAGPDAASYLGRAAPPAPAGVQGARGGAAPARRPGARGGGGRGAGGGGGGGAGGGGGGGRGRA